MNPSKTNPAKFSWAPEATIEIVNIDGISLRTATMGSGPDLVLLHTVRTQMDLFQKLAPMLARDFTVHMIDFPGHGQSDIPQEALTAPFIMKFVDSWLRQKGLRGAVVVGESIGAVTALKLASEQHPAVGKVVAISTYDYGRGLGLARGNLISRFVVTGATIPIFGEIVMALNNPMIEAEVLRGGTTHRGSFPKDLLKTLYEAGRRKGYSRGFLSVLRNADSWTKFKDGYRKITAPVLLIYGEYDWSKMKERKQTHAMIPGALEVTVPNSGHFLSVDNPDAVVAHIKRFTKG